MKTKVYLFRLMVGLAAFALGISVYLVWQTFSTKTVPAIPVIVKPIATSSPVFVPLPPADTAQSETAEEETDSFYPDGDYYLIGDAPKGFKDFDYLTITANKYEVEKDGTSYWKAILPEGHIFTKTEFKFSRVFINNREISFETKTVKGISYKFIGTYPKELILSEKEKEYIYLQGKLMKFKDGKKVAEIEAKFGAMSDC